MFNETRHLLLPAGGIRSLLLSGSGTECPFQEETLIRFWLGRFTVCVRNLAVPSE